MPMPIPTPIIFCAPYALVTPMPTLRGSAPTPTPLYCGVTYNEFVLSTSVLTIFFEYKGKIIPDGVATDPCGA